MEALQGSISQIRRLKKYDLLTQIVALGLVVTSALMMWKTFVVISGSEAPVVVVLSGSMEPAFYRGDILVLTMDDEPYKVGDIVVYTIQREKIPIVHRVIEVHEPTAKSKDKEVRLLTKGDNNRVDDRGLYSHETGQLWLRPSDITGKAKVHIPYLGIFTILMADYPMLKYVVLGTMAILVLGNKEEGK